MSTKIKLFSGKNYISNYDWNAKSFNADDGNSFLKPTPFIEVFFEDYHVRGDGSTFEEAEEQAWQKHQKIKNCKGHEFIRKTDSGFGYCKHCNKKTYDLENLQKCTDCGDVAYFYNEYNPVCSNHFMEIVEKETEPSKFSLIQYNKMKYLKEKNKGVSEKELYDEMKSLSKFYDFLTDTIEEIGESKEGFTVDQMFDIADDIKKDYIDVSIALDSFLDKTDSNAILLKEMIRGRIWN